MNLFKQHFPSTFEKQRFCYTSRWPSHISDKQLTEDVLTQPLFALCSKACFQLDLISWRTDSVELIKGFQGLWGLCDDLFGLFFFFLLLFIYFFFACFFISCCFFSWFFFKFSEFILSLLLTFHSSLHICSGSGLPAADVVDFWWL